MSLAIGLTIGLAAGVLGGILGIGGGIIMIPGMVYLLNMPQHTAQGVSLAAMAVTASVGAYSHYRQGNVRLSIVPWIIPTAMVFALLGAYLAGMLEASLLQRVFGVVLLLMGGRMVIAR